jgi:hypothetical protein
MSSPDLFGYRYLAGRWSGCSVVECKGHSKNLSGGKSASPDYSPASAADLLLPKEARSAGGAMLQALARTHVGAVVVDQHIASHVHFSRLPGPKTGRPVLNFLWKDPGSRVSDLNPEQMVKILSQFIKDYYAPVLNLLGFDLTKPDKNVGRRPGTMQQTFASHNFSMSIHPAIAAAASDDTPAAWATLPNILFRERVSPSGNLGVFTGGDGITVEILK